MHRWVRRKDEFFLSSSRSYYFLHCIAFRKKEEDWFLLWWLNHYRWLSRVFLRSCSYWAMFFSWFFLWWVLDLLALLCMEGMNWCMGDSRACYICLIETTGISFRKKEIKKEPFSVVFFLSLGQLGFRGWSIARGGRLTRVFHFLRVFSVGQRSEEHLEIRLVLDGLGPAVGRWSLRGGLRLLQVQAPGEYPLVEMNQSPRETCQSGCWHVAHFLFQSYMDSEIMAIMSQYMPIDNHNNEVQPLVRESTV